MSIPDNALAILQDAIDPEYYSNCCGANVYAPTDDWAICLGCKEYCEAEKGEPEPTPAKKVEHYQVQNYDIKDKK